MNNKNMVDERFELISIIFRLAGRDEYSSVVKTDYQKDIVENFVKYYKHEVVKFAKKWSELLCFDVPLMFAVHIEKKNGEFVFIEDINSLYEFDRWTDGRAEEFLPLFNKFYKDTNYEDFYNSHIPYFEKVTKKFNEKHYRHIDFEWFGKYLNTSNLRCIVSPSDWRYNYASTVNDIIVYCLVREDGNAIVHEYCHKIAHQLAGKWYEENLEFKKWCDDSVDINRFPAYGSGKVMAQEYVTNAYNILYNCQSKDNREITELNITSKFSEFAPIMMMHYIKNGFPYMGEVYIMILSLEK
jgi:hypothetical protein